MKCETGESLPQERADVASDMKQFDSKHVKTLTFLCNNRSVICTERCWDVRFTLSAALLASPKEKLSFCCSC